MSCVCGICRSVLLDRARDYVFFYVQNQQQVFIAIKPEKEGLLRRKRKGIIEFTRVDDLQRKKLKKVLEEFTCTKCKGKLGSVIPFGPDNRPFMCFARDRISLCGEPVPKKTNNKNAPKFYNTFKTVTAWSEIERRSNETFLPQLGSSAKPRANFSGQDITQKSQTTQAPLKLPMVRSLLPNSISLLNAELGWKERAAAHFAVNGCDSHPGTEGGSQNHYESLTSTCPRNYQIEGIVEALLRNLVLVLPTGAGKTLIAANVITRMKILNPERMCLFVVDRVPLVFQQGLYLERETGLRVCMMCGENRSKLKVRQLNGACFDVLVITAGCLFDIAEKGELRLCEQFACVVFDECHHAIGNHKYCRLLDIIVTDPSHDYSSKPRLLGLTASPVGVTGSSNANKGRLVELCKKFGGGAGIYYPSVPGNTVQTEWVVLHRTAEQDCLCRTVIGELKNLTEAVNSSCKRLTSLGEVADIDPSGGLVALDQPDNLDFFLHPATLGRIRGQLRGVSQYVETSINDFGDLDAFVEAKQGLDKMVDAIQLLLGSLETTEIMGPKFGLLVLQEIPFISQNQAMPVPLGSLVKRIESGDQFPTETDLVSPRLQRLMKMLAASMDTDLTSRVLVIVHTRSAARQLTEYLSNMDFIATNFRPQMVVGHGGFDGMDWFDEQETVLNEFRSDADGSCRLLVATSVLEEGLDVAECDLVVRLQGVQSLIGMIQSRGRARRSGSKMVVFVGEFDRRKEEEMQRKEATMRLEVRHMAARQGLPSQQAAQTIRELSKEYQGSFCGQEFQATGTFQRYTFNPQPSHDEIVFNFFLPQDSHIELEILEEKLLHAFVVCGVPSLCVSRILHLHDSLGVAQGIFENCASVLLALRCRERDQREVHLAYAQLCREWAFDLGGTSKVWLHRMSVARCQDSSRRRRLANMLFTAPHTQHEHAHGSFIGCSFGRWSSLNQYEERQIFEGEDVLSVNFRKKDGIQISFSTSRGLFSITAPDLITGLFLYIPPAMIAGFSVVDWGNGRNEVRIYVPLSAVPFASMERGGSETQTRIASVESFRPLAAAAVNNVLCLSLANDTDPRCVLCLEKEILAVPLFETRVTVEDDSNNGAFFETEHSFHLGENNICNPHSTHLPIFSNAFGSVRDAHWLLLSVFSQRLGCLTDVTRASIWNKSVGIVGNPPEMVNLALSHPDQTSALIYALEQLLNIPYWADAEGIFEQSLSDFDRLPLPCNCPNDEDSSQEPGSRDEGNWFKAYRVIVTPTRVMYFPPIQVKGSRLFRRFGSERFVSVSFRDEHQQKLYGSELIAYTEMAVRSGRVFAGRRTLFFACSSSQLREQQLLFVDSDLLSGTAITAELSCTSMPVEEQMKAMRNSIVDPNSSKSCTAARYLSRLALFCTADTPTVILRNTEVKRVSDNFTASIDGSSPSILTDGCGLICYSVAAEIARDFLYLDVPSAFQIRWQGIKGTVVVVQDNNPLLWEGSQGKYCKMVVRPSMEKFQTGSADDGRLCIVSHSKFQSMYLNREIITLLGSIPEESGHGLSGKSPWILSQVLETRLKDVLEENATFLQDEEAARAILEQYLMPCFKRRLDDLPPSVAVLKEPFFVDALRSQYRFLIRGIVDKARIPVQKGCLLMGIADPFGVLQDGEIFVNISHHEDRIPERSCGDGGRSSVLVKDRVALWRNPCLHPGDVRIVSAVDCEELQNLIDVVVFPSMSGIRRNIPLACSGGDLDGDLFSVVWDDDLIPPAEYEVEPLPYNEMDPCSNSCARQPEERGLAERMVGLISQMFRGENSPEEENAAIQSISQNSQTQNSFDNDDLATFIGNVFANDLLGRIATMHLVVSDIQKDGARDSLAKQLAKAQSFAVDFPKSGIAPRVPKAVGKLIKEHGYPDFMENRNNETYISQKPLGFLFRHAASFDFTYQSVSLFGSDGYKQSPAVVDPRFILSGREKHKSNTESLYTVYMTRLRGLMVSYGLKSDAECVMARALKWNAMISDHGKAKDAIVAQVTSLFRQFREIFLAECASLSSDERANVASCWYDVAYSDGRAKSFALIPMDILLKHVKEHDAHVEKFGFLGQIGDRAKEYCLEAVDKSLMQTLAIKLSVLEPLRHSLETAGIDSQLLNILPYGSVAQGVARVDSDLDVAIILNFSSRNMGGILSRLGMNSTKDLLTAFAEQRSREAELLKLVFSPVLGEICSTKWDILDAPVPLVRCTIPSPMDSETHVQVDVTCNSSGCLKASWLHFLSTQNGGNFYCVLLILCRWAAAAGVIRSGSTDIAENNSSGNTVMAPSFDDGFLTSSELHALICHCCLETESDVILRNQFLQIRRIIFKDSMSNLKHLVLGSDAKIVAHMLLTFFKKVKTLRQMFLYRWPINLHSVVANAEVDKKFIEPPELISKIDVSRLEKLALLCDPARHCLLACGDISQLMDLAMGDSKVSTFNRKLSVALSHRIGFSADFHASRLGLTTQCEVTIESMEGSGRRKPRLLLTAKGTRRCLMKLKEELACYSKAAVWNCRSVVEASRYFMEGSSLLRVFGCSEDSQIRFLKLLRGNVVGNPVWWHAKRRLASYSLCRAVQEEPTSPKQVLEDKSIVNSLVSLFSNQFLQMPPLNSFETVRLTVGFGHFVIINVEAVLPETRRTFSLREIHEGMQKCGRKRRNCFRADPTTLMGQNGQGDQPSSCNKKFAMESLQAGVSGPPQRGPAKKTVKDKKKAPGLPTTFIPSFDGDAIGMDEKCCKALESCGFSPVEPDSSIHGQNPDHSFVVTISLSRGYEVVIEFEKDPAGQRVPVPKQMAERALSWIHATILGNAQLPDLRIRLRSTVKISENLSHLAIGDCGPPITWNDEGAPCFSIGLTQKRKKQVNHVRRKILTRKFASLEYSSEIFARVSIARDWFRGDDGLLDINNGVTACELSLEMDCDVVRKMANDQREASIWVERLFYLSKQIGLALAVQCLVVSTK